MIDERTKRTFQRAAADQDLVEWLKQERHKQAEHLVVQVTPHLIHHTQGRVKALDEILVLINAVRTL